FEKNLLPAGPIPPPHFKTRIRPEWFRESLLPRARLRYNSPLFVEPRWPGTINDTAASDRQAMTLHMTVRTQNDSCRRT
ncbi:MAG: hypothetical protein MUQ10_07165, partial [Anaerolineae bacterium]|nr:hypothetical protein [Anaerolineae bacterium]